MSGPLLRYARAEDVPVLREIWALCFGDSEALMDIFFSLFFSSESCVVAELDGQVRSAAYLLPDIRLLDGKGSETPVMYFYALATHPEYRGRGLGQEVTLHCMALAKEKGASICLYPADDDLREWYALGCGLRDLGLIETLYLNPTICGDVPAYGIRKLSPVEYVQLREQFLAERPHAALPELYYRFLAALIDQSDDDGGLLALDIHGQQALACVSMRWNSLDVHELLFPGDPKVVAAALMDHYRGEGCSLQMPGASPSAEVSVMGDRVDAVYRGLWWGPMLD